MKPQAALVKLLARVGAQREAPVLVNEEELSQWPAAAVAAMKSQKLITKARPAASAVCPGCERECVMPVHTPPTKTRKPTSFIVCESAVTSIEWLSRGAGWNSGKSHAT